MARVYASQRRVTILSRGRRVGLESAAAMKSHTEYFTFHTKKKRELVHLTPRLEEVLVHHEVTVPITKGRLDLGTWQRVFYAEFDGQRDKRLIVKLLGF
jgi:thiamine phosphate synthase YjbQ (UPF0047 family)